MRVKKLTPTQHKTPAGFLQKHAANLRRLAAEEQRCGECTAWLSRAIEALDEHHEVPDAPR